MKHTLSITLIIAAIFLLSQVVGLFTVNQYITVDLVNGTPVVTYPTTLLGEPPEVEDKSLSFIPIFLAILVGTAFVFVLIHFKLGKLWKYWFLFAVVITLAVSFDVYIPNAFIAFILALVLGLIKVFKPNIFVHNFTEIFIYAGITIAVLPFFNLFSAFMLLIAISIYDAIAVWKSKHMIKLAEFQTKSKIFAGFLIPYKDKREADVKMAKAKSTAKYTSPSVSPIKDSAAKQKLTKKRLGKGKAKNAILGGGDIAFPLIFASVVMQHLIEIDGLSKIAAFGNSLIIAVTTTIALALLLSFSKANRYYPAMPFISAGCVLGYVIILVL